jgi:UDP-N-acetylmuramate--alanine ligase
MHIFFSGIGGTAIGPLAQIATQAGFTVSGSDKQASDYTDYLAQQGIDFYIGQSRDQIAKLHQEKPIDWYVYSSAVAMEQSQPEELLFCQEHDIKTSKRDELINHILKQTGQKMIAIAGTHGKTTTTAMVIWLYKQLDIPISYSIGAKIPFGDMGQFNQAAEYFVYEADEYDRNFLSFHPALSIIAGIDWDHPDIYPTRESYNQAFQQFINQSDSTYVWQDDAKKLDLKPRENITILEKTDLANRFNLVGGVNRENAAIVVETITDALDSADKDTLITQMNQFPGLSRRFEELAPNLFTDYAHTPAKIRGAIDIAKEHADNEVVVVYEGLHNTRQHFIKDELVDVFSGAKKVYIVPSYRAREDESLEDLTPEKLSEIISGMDSAPSELNQDLLDAIEQHRQAGDLVLCLSAGGGGSLDEWLRQNVTN